jgi:methionyl-tRNA formyltransferase
MTQKSNQLVFFGTEDYSATVLDNLLSAGIAIEAVITKPDLKKGRGQKLQAPAVKTIAENYNVTVYQPENLTQMRDAITQTSRFGAILVSFGKIIPQDIIDSFELGIINLHPSLLPKYRGPSPIESAIYNGDNLTGVSIMTLNDKMDAGAIYAQAPVEITPATTASQLYQQTAQLGSKLLIQILPQIIAGKLSPEPQDDTQATYCSLLTKAQGWLNPEKSSADQLVNQIRAYNVFPKSRLEIYDQICIITNASADNQPTSPLNFECVDGQFLNIHQLIAPSGKTMTATAFINGYKN